MGALLGPSVDRKGPAGLCSATIWGLQQLKDRDPGSVRRERGNVLPSFPDSNAGEGGDQRGASGATDGPPVEVAPGLHDDGQDGGGYWPRAVLGYAAERLWVSEEKPKTCVEAGELVDQYDQVRRMEPVHEEQKKRTSHRRMGWLKNLIRC